MSMTMTTTMTNNSNHWHNNTNNTNKISHQYHEIFRKRVNLLIVGNNQQRSEISVVLHAVEYHNPYTLSLIIVDTPTIAKIDVTKDELALELRLWLNGKMIDCPSKVISSRITESMMNFLKFGRPPAQTDIFLWMLSRIEIIKQSNPNKLLLYFGGIKNSISQNATTTTSVLKGLISNPNNATTANETDNSTRSYQSSTFHTKPTFERSKSAPTSQRMERTSGNAFMSGSHQLVSQTQQFITTEQIIGKSQALEELSKVSVKGRKDAKKTLVNLELTDDHYRLMNHIQRRRKDIEQSLETRRRIVITGTARNDQTMSKYRQIRETNSRSLKNNSWIRQANDEVMTLDRIQTALDEDIKRQHIQNLRNRDHIRWTMAPNGYEIYRGKYQKGYVIGSGPLPADATTSLRDPRIDSTLQHYTWDEHGRRHQKNHTETSDSNDDDNTMSVVMEIIRKASTNSSLYKLNLKELFHEMDSSGDGYLTISELNSFFLSLGLKLDPSILQVLYNHFDANQSGSIHYSEFLWAFFNRRSFLKQWKKNTKILTKLQIENIFNKHDVNGNGTLNKKEFEKLLKKFQIKLSPNDIEILMDRFDLDGDGELDLEEFYEYIQQEINASSPSPPSAPPPPPSAPNQSPVDAIQQSLNTIKALTRSSNGSSNNNDEKRIMPSKVIRNETIPLRQSLDKRPEKKEKEKMEERKAKTTKKTKNESIIRSQSFKSLSSSRVDDPPPYSPSSHLRDDEEDQSPERKDYEHDDDDDDEEGYEIIVEEEGRNTATTQPSILKSNSREGERSYSVSVDQIQQLLFKQNQIESKLGRKYFKTIK